MLLICMAHLGEAQKFISALKLKRVDNNFYQSINDDNDDYSLLLTGEGPTQVLTKLPYYIGKYNIDRVVNLGIAGCLDPNLELQQIYSIRTLYAYGETEAKFHSYTTANIDTTIGPSIDCITADQRVLTDDYSKKLSHHAKIVDREAWAVARVCQEFKLTFFCYKLLSDHAGQQTACFDLKDQAEYFSEKLFDFFQDSEFNQQIIPQKEKEIELPFHASFTQQKRIELLLKYLSNTATLEELIISSRVLHPETHEKHRAKLFVTHLEETLNPINKTIENKMQGLIQQIHQAGASISYDKKFEKQKISLRMDINSQKNIDNLISALEQTSFAPFEDLWQGRFDV